MKAEQVIELITTLEPTEIERLFVLIKEYEIEVRRRRALDCDAVDESFKIIADQVFTQNRELFQKLTDFEAQERTQK